jgi:hypothetical protein
MKGTFKGVNWRSLTLDAQIKAFIVERRVKAFGTKIHEQYSDGESLAVFLKSEVTQQERMIFYKFSGKYFNNKSI